MSQIKLSISCFRKTFRSADEGKKSGKNCVRKRMAEVEPDEFHVGMNVSAKFSGAWCEGKITEIEEQFLCKVSGAFLRFVFTVFLFFYFPHEICL